MKILFLINDINFFVSHRLDLALSFKKKGFIPIIVLGKQASLQMNNYKDRKNDLDKLEIHYLNFRSSNSNIFVFIKDIAFVLDDWNPSSETDLIIACNIILFSGESFIYNILLTLFSCDNITFSFPFIIK